MTSLSWSLGLDRLGWPTLTGPVGKTWQLWPVTWWQFEAFVAESRAMTNTDYERILARAEPKRPGLGAVRHDDAQVRGITAEEAREFAAWMGRGWHLPKDAEWRELLAAAARIEPEPYVRQLNAALLADLDLLQRRVASVFLSTAVAGGSMVDTMLLGRHAYEWVTTHRGFGLRGANLRRSGVLSFVGDAAPIEPLAGMLDALLPFAGVRLVRTSTQDGQQ
ncbi:MAG: SUMF1/EgtB/PvdO family nonheme iron enzyme [Actinomycetota bacterium]|jgi:hypothetical protein|nr:SUMF1/EgtB/PvdO family nonheme iron enzyme [Actinomycetota bacterium]